MLLPHEATLCYNVNKTKKNIRNTVTERFSVTNVFFLAHHLLILLSFKNFHLRTLLSTEKHEMKMHTTTSVYL